MPTGNQLAVPRFAAVSDGHALSQQIARNISQAPGFILISGCETGTCDSLLDSLESALCNTGLPIRLRVSTPPTTLFEQLGNRLGSTVYPASAIELSQHFGARSVFLLCSATETLDPQDLEQLRQLSNIQLEPSHLAVVLCGGKRLGQSLPPTLKQRITVAYRLDQPGNLRLHNMAWLGLTALLAVGVALYLLAPSIPPSPGNPALPALSSATLPTSLKAGPVLVTPDSEEINDLRPRIFQSEAEALAALQSYEAPQKPSQK